MVDSQIHPCWSPPLLSPVSDTCRLRAPKLPSAGFQLVLVSRKLWKETGEKMREDGEMVYLPFLFCLPMSLDPGCTGPTLYNIQLLIKAQSGQDQYKVFLSRSKRGKEKEGGEMPQPVK